MYRGTRRCHGKKRKPRSEKGKERKLGKEEEIVTGHLSQRGRKREEVNGGGMRAMWATEWNMCPGPIGGGWIGRVREEGEGPVSGAARSWWNFQGTSSEIDRNLEAPIT